MTNDYLIIYVRLFYMKTDASLVPVFICPRRKVVLKQQLQFVQPQRYNIVAFSALFSKFNLENE